MKPTILILFSIAVSFAQAKVRPLMFAQQPTIITGERGSIVTVEIDASSPVTTVTVRVAPPRQSPPSPVIPPVPVPPPATPPAAPPPAVDPGFTVSSGKLTVHRGEDGPLALTFPVAVTARDTCYFRHDDKYPNLYFRLELPERSSAAIRALKVYASQLRAQGVFLHFDLATPTMLDVRKTLACTSLAVKDGAWSQMPVGPVARMSLTPGVSPRAGVVRLNVDR